MKKMKKKTVKRDGLTFEIEVLDGAFFTPQMQEQMMNEVEAEYRKRQKSNTKKMTNESIEETLKKLGLKTK